MYRLLPTLCIHFLCLCLSAQGDSNAPAQQWDIIAFEQEISSWLDQIGSAPEDGARLAASDSIESALARAARMDSEGLMSKIFASWRKMASLTPEDAAFRLFNWNIALQDGSHAFRACFVYPDGSSRMLRDERSLLEVDEFQSLDADQWYGALYYYIETVKHKGDTYYTVLGWNGLDDIRTAKVMDVIRLDASGELSFGKPVFEHEEGVRSRRIFVYAEDASMTLAYLKDKQAIVYDVLVPKPGLAPDAGAAYMVPGTEHNAYRLKAGRYSHEQGIDMSRPKSDEGKAQFNFPARPDYTRTRSKSNPLKGD